MTTDCERFMEDPEAHRAHAETCADCRRFVDELHRLDEGIRTASIEAAPVAPKVGTDLPLAAWEGAHHRSWNVVLVGAIVVVLLAVSGFVFGGISPVTGFVSAVQQSVLAQSGWMALFRALPRLLQHAPAPVHFFLAAAFVTVNVILYLLLRRSPKGYDVPHR